MVANTMPRRVADGYVAMGDRAAAEPPAPKRQTPEALTKAEERAAYKALPLDIRIVGRFFERWIGGILNWWKARPLYRLAMWMPHAYTQSRSFVLAHTCFFVSRETARARRAACAACQYRYEHKDHLYCRGANDGSGCCGEWPAARIWWKTLLSAFRCPQGKWGFGRLATWMAVPDNLKLVWECSCAAAMFVMAIVLWFWFKD